MAGNNDPEITIGGDCGDQSIDSYRVHLQSWRAVRWLWGEIMRTFWKLGGAGLALICSSAAQAADMPVKAPPVAAEAPFSWTGFYAGVNVGAIQDVDKVRNGTLAFEPILFTDVAGAFTGIPGIIVGVPGTIPLPVSYSRTGGSSILGGGQFGYNWQVGHTVIGLEADVDGMHTSENLTGALAPQTFTGVAPGSAVTRSLTGNINVERDWQATLRGRLGYAWDRWLVYGTGGASVTDVRTQAAFTAVTTLTPASLVPIIGVANGTTTTTSSQTLWGYTIGAGLERALTNAIVVGAEYRYTHYGSWTPALGTTPAGFTPVIFPPTGSLSLVTHQVTLRLSYLFGR
jgi:outer membrane immunogenic protein